MNLVLHRVAGFSGFVTKNMQVHQNRLHASTQAPTITEKTQNVAPLSNAERSYWNELLIHAGMKNLFGKSLSYPL